jgi:hypothetical protein
MKDSGPCKLRSRYIGIAIAGVVKSQIIAPTSNLNHLTNLLLCHKRMTDLYMHLSYVYVYTYTV